jgi:hypothetical protein
MSSPHNFWQYFVSVFIEVECFHMMCLMSQCRYDRFVHKNLYYSATRQWEFGMKQ